MKKPTLSLIFAMSENRVIGHKNTLPWHLPDDLAFFKKHTLNKPIIMGRKTFESIGKPLPKRTNIILSSKNANINGTKSFTSIETAMECYQNETELMIIGGAMLYNTMIPKMNRLYLTTVHAIIEGDTFIDPINFDHAHCVFEAHHPVDERHQYAFTFQIWDF